MEIAGKLFKVLQKVEGQGKNGKWVKCDFVIETEEKFPKKVCLTAWGDLVDTINNNYREGDAIKVQFDVSSREYNGKWYTDLKAWRFDTAGESSSSAKSSQTSKSKSSNSEQHWEPTGDSGVNDDLPF